MKHLKSVNSFIFESDSKYIKNRNVSRPVYHVGGYKFDVLKNLPTWFSLEKKHSDDGWFKNMIDNTGEAYQYKGRVIGKVGHIFDEDVEDLFKKYQIDSDDWMMSLIENPHPTDVLKLSGTKMLMTEGFVGLIYPDYDPTDWGSDLDALIVFEPKQSITNFKLINQYP